jgi:transcriptional regulator with XRE-family HTH domain
MRRLMLNMSQTNLGDALGLTFQQVQKYDKGTNRIAASRLQQLAAILEVPIEFFFEDAQTSHGRVRGGSGDAPAPDYMSDFFATTDGVALSKAFMQIKQPRLRRCIHLVEEIAEDAD